MLGSPSTSIKPGTLQFTVPARTDLRRCMTVSMRVMSAGDGYKYLLRSVAAADGDRSLSTPLTRYYAEQETPSGSKSSRVLLGSITGVRVGGRGVKDGYGSGPKNVPVR